jgi:hypothetical protein
MSSLYLKLIPQILLARDSSYKQIIWDRRDASLMQILRTDLAEHSEGMMLLPALTSPPAAATALPFGGVATAAVIWIACDQTCNVRLNGGTTDIPLVPSGSYPGFMLQMGAFTAVTIANQGGSIATVEYFFVGL